MLACTFPHRLATVVAVVLVIAAGPGGAPGALSDNPAAAPPSAGTKPAPQDPPRPAIKPPALVLTGDCSGQRFIGQRIACYSDLAVQAADATVCFQARDPDVRWPCVAKYAVVAGNAATCRLLAGPGPDEAAGTLAAAEGAGTVDLCLSTLALVYRRPELCRQLRTEPMDDACLAKLVAHGANPALCDEVQSPELRQVCHPDPDLEIRE